MRRRKFQRWWGLGLGLLIAFCWLGPYMLEPRDDLRYEDAVVLSYQSGVRRAGYFTVVSTTSGKSWEVREIRGRFPHDYRGPAVLAISRGRWTGRVHVGLWNERPEKGQAANPGQR